MVFKYLKLVYDNRLYCGLKHFLLCIISNFFYLNVLKYVLFVYSTCFHFSYLIYSFLFRDSFSIEGLQPGHETIDKTYVFAICLCRRHISKQDDAYKVSKWSMSFVILLCRLLAPPLFNCADFNDFTLRY